MNVAATEVREPSDDSGRRRCDWSRGERAWFIVALCGVLAYGGYLERRTALRTVPMTDFTVFANAAWAVRTGGDLYNIADCHGWHYQYPPLLAIALVPLAVPPPAPLPPLAPGEPRTLTNTPWGYPVIGSQYFGLHRTNARFFIIIAAWYILGVLGVCFSTHALACALETGALRDPPPTDEKSRADWWKLRLLPVFVCAGSLATDLARGQVDIALLALIAVALYLAARGRELAAGFCLAIPAAVKLFPPFLLLYPFYRRRWWMAAGVVLGLTLGLVVVPVIVFGPARTVGFYRTWSEVLAKPALGAGKDRSRAVELTNMTTAMDNQSLVAAIHNWRYIDRPRSNRPAQTTAAVRLVSYIAGVLGLAAIAFAAGWRRRDPPRDLLILAGLLVGLALVVSPIVHNYYYLLLLPLVAALLDRHRAERPEHHGLRVLPWPLVVFMAVDVLTRLPRIGLWLRDAGAPLVTVVILMIAGARALTRDRLVRLKPVQPAG